jgi:hypothetical protein
MLVTKQVVETEAIKVNQSVSKIKVSLFLPGCYNDNQVAQITSLIEMQQLRIGLLIPGVDTTEIDFVTEGCSV